MEAMHGRFREGDALLLVDVQKDFCPGGALAIEAGDAIVPVLNSWIEAATMNGNLVYASRDWHPLRHISFKEQGGHWQQHCLADSDGARFHPDLRLPETTLIVTKGVRFDQDQNSVFDQTGFAFQLRRDSVKRLYVGGLALDVCVLASVLDALRDEFQVKLIGEGTRPVSVPAGEEALRKMKLAGAEII